MQLIKTDLTDPYLIDERGFFFERWSYRTFEILGVIADFVQDIAFGDAETYA